MTSWASAALMQSAFAAFEAVAAVLDAPIDAVAWISSIATNQGQANACSEDSPESCSSRPPPEKMASEADIPALQAMFEKMQESAAAKNVEQQQQQPPKRRHPSFYIQPPAVGTSRPLSVKAPNASKVTFSLPATVHLVAKLPYDAIRGDAHRPDGPDPDFLTLGIVRQLRIGRFAGKFVLLKTLWAWSRHCAYSTAPRLEGGSSSRRGLSTALMCCWFDEPGHCHRSPPVELDDATSLEGRSDGATDGSRHWCSPPAEGAIDATRAENFSWLLSPLQRHRAQVLFDRRALRDRKVTRCVS